MEHDQGKANELLKEQDMAAIRELAKEYAEAAALPVQAEKIRLWNKLNNFRPERPMVLIDQECWSEFGDERLCRATVDDGYWGMFEILMRRTLYKWRHYPVDMVLNPYVSLPRPYHSTGFGIEEVSQALQIEESSEIASRFFENQIKGFEDLERIHPPVITVDEAMETRIREEAEAIFGGVIPYKLQGKCPHLGAWDMISAWMGVENCYMALADSPELMHALIGKVTDCMLAQIEAMNAAELIDVTGNKCHCSVTFLDGASSSQRGKAVKGVSENAWAFGMAQLFTAVSPAVTEEFEVAYQKKVFARFESIYYGCCERLDDRMDMLEKLPNVRKISMSPWSDRQRFCERIPAGRVVSAKPNPALIAAETFDEEVIRAEIRGIIGTAAALGRPLELILKDINTVKHAPARLERWAAIAMEEACR